jgi:8-oxo-dGTP pyrophosphatase MutT (NUDIX family)
LFLVLINTREGGKLKEAALRETTEEAGVIGIVEVIIDIIKNLLFSDRY